MRSAPTPAGHRTRLILSRRPGEELVIGDDPPVVVTVLRLRGSAVRLAVEAPADVPVFRRELLGDDLDVSTAPITGTEANRHERTR